MTSLAQRTQHAWPDGARCVIGLTLDFDGTSLERGREKMIDMLAKSVDA